MTDRSRLIEVAFPLKQASLDSVHEKNVRHGHISTLHIWPARRPLAACRAALIATLLPDPGTLEERQRLLEKIGGTIVQKIEKKKINGKIVEVIRDETVGGILHWGRESSPDLEWFRQEIRKAYGGRAPKVLDPFAGGGAIPLEAMRLGCEATAIDINPVAWFILKCTLEYPQKLAGQYRPLPRFALDSPEFMEGFFRGTGKLTKKQLERNLQAVQSQLFPPPDVDLAWHVRAWGWWVLQRAKADLERFYPTVDGKPTVAYLWARTVTCKNCRDTVPLLKTRWLCKKDNKRVVLTLTPGLSATPSPQVERGGGGEVPGYVYELCRQLRAQQTPVEQILWEALRDRRLGGFKFRRQHPFGRYIADFYCAEAELVIEIDGPIHDQPDQKGYDHIREETLKARNLQIIRFKNEEIENSLDKILQTILAHLPLSTRGEGSGVRFDIQTAVPQIGGNAAQRREYDKRIGAGTMSRSGATCPCCGTIMTMEDIRLEGQARRLGAVMTAVVVDGQNGKEYRLPTDDERAITSPPPSAPPLHSVERGPGGEADRVFAEIPFGLPEEPLPSKEALGFRVPLYGFDKWHKLFTPRQLLALGTFTRHTRAARDAMHAEGYPPEWVEAVGAYLALAVDRLADRGSTICTMVPSRETIGHTFARFALPITWDFAESVTINDATGGYPGSIDWVSRYIDHAIIASANGTSSSVFRQSATITDSHTEQIDIVLTDPPYYDAIPYSDLMDFFYVWLRRTLHGLSPKIDVAFNEPLAPKWDHSKNDGELIDDSSRHGGDKEKSKAAYEDGMFRAFQACYQALKPEGRLVIVFAHKHPDAWETLVSAIIRAGFVVDGSWPIQTEMGNRTRALSSAALSSSVWLVCKKRPEAARPGWDNRVLEEMRENIYTRLHQFWDAGIRGPDFVWAATGPALEAYSKHPVVKKANEPGKVMPVSEFLRAVRRIVVDFVVGRVLTSPPGPLSTEWRGGAEGGGEVSLDDVTTYYLLHRHDFGLEDAPSGACILYAISCGLSDSALADQYDILIRTGGTSPPEPLSTEWRGGAEGGGEEDSEAEVEEGTGSTVKLRPWHQRKRPGMGYDPATDSPRARRHAAMVSLFPDMDQPVVRTREVPLIDQIHRLMHLWKAGDVVSVDEYINERALRRNVLFHQLLQALIELAGHGTEERSLLESISNHVVARGVSPEKHQAALSFDTENGGS